MANIFFPCTYTLVIGAQVTTSAIIGKPSSGSVVRTNSGSKYFLGQQASKDSRESVSGATCAAATVLPPQNPSFEPSFEEAWLGKCAAVDSSLMEMEDIDVNEGSVISRLARNSNCEPSSRVHAKVSRRQRLIFVACMALALLIGFLATVAIVASTNPKQSNEVVPSMISIEDGNLRGTPTSPKVEEDLPLVSLVESTSTPPLESLSEDGSSEEDEDVDEDEDLDDNEEEEEEYTSVEEPTLPQDTDQDDTVSGTKCIPEIKFKKDLLEDVEPCGDECSSEAVMVGDTAVVKHNNNIYYFSNKDGADMERSPSVYRGPSPNMQFAISDSVTVVSDVTEREDVFIVDNASGGKGRRVRILDGSSKVEGFGKSVDIDGDLIVIGSDGTAYVYRYFNERWSLDTELTQDYGPDEDFAEQVAVKGDMVAVTGFNEQDQTAVFVYRWGELVDEIIIDEQPCEVCEDVGLSLAFTDESDLLIGYPRKQAFYYFALEEEDDEYVFKQENSLSEDYRLDQLSVSGNIMVIGGRSDLLVFAKVSNDWIEVGKLSYPQLDVGSIHLHDENLLLSSGNEVRWYTLSGCNATPDSN